MSPPHLYVLLNLPVTTICLGLILICVYSVFKRWSTLHTHTVIYTHTTAQMHTQTQSLGYVLTSVSRFSVCFVQCFQPDLCRQLKKKKNHRHKNEWKWSWNILISGLLGFFQGFNGVESETFHTLMAITSAADTEYIIHTQQNKQSKKKRITITINHD